MTWKKLFLTFVNNLCDGVRDVDRQAAEVVRDDVGGGRADQDR